MILGMGSVISRYFRAIRSQESLADDIKIELPIETVILYTIVSPIAH